MQHTTGFNRPRIDAGRDADVAFWARLLDASPEEIRGAVTTAGPDVNAVRSFLAARQLGFDFGPRPAEIAATPARNI